jgi:hypothetical protein
MIFFSKLSMISLILLLTSCSSEIDDFANVDAKAIDTFMNAEELKSGPHLKIKHTAMHKNFFFYGTFIPMLNSPTGHSLKGRIIHFERFASHVVMLESPKGHSIADESDSNILLAEFPIIEESSDGIVIDFAKGMNTAFTTRNVNASALSEKEIGTSDQFKAISLLASFVKSIESHNDILTIKQIAQWRNEKSEIISAEFRYFLREYLPHPNFEKIAFSKQRFVQYFSTPSQIQAPSTKTIAYLTRWPSDKNIIFYISSNTPQEYKQAIKDGMLYWNHIFQKNLFEVRDLDPGLSAPHSHLNIIQWVPWDNEASAYADMVVDHLSGETMQAQIYLRSGWVFKSARNLKKELEDLVLSSPNNVKVNALSEDIPIPSMFDIDDPCFLTLDDYESLIDLFNAVANQKIDDSVLKLLTADIIRTVVAHETGHILGLRHNLASSTAGNLSLKERDKLLKKYLNTAAPVLAETKTLTKSVMDVFSAADDALLGSQIRDLSSRYSINKSPFRKLYSYDAQAIDYGYFKKPMLGTTPFCTDEDIETFIDCTRWDLTKDEALFAAKSINGIFFQVASVLAETMVDNVDPKHPGGPLAIADLPLSHKNSLPMLENQLKRLFSQFNKNARSIKIETALGAYGSHNAKKITEERFLDLRNQITANGLHESLFALVPPFRDPSLSASSLTERFALQLSRALKDRQEKSPELHFSDEDNKLALDIAYDFFSAMLDDVNRLFALVVSKTLFDDPNFQEPIEEALGQVARELILSSKDNKTSPGKSPQFTYPLATRDAAALLLNPALGILPDWSFDNLADISSRLRLLMRMHVGNNSKSIDLSSLPREKRQWLIEQNHILNTLNRMKSMTRVLNP